jgi:hypothetical protein
MLTASCHCGAVKIEVPRRPRRLTDCNCSICRRYGARWAYYQAPQVRIIAARGATASYSWGDRFLKFVRCANCGTVTHWQQSRGGNQARMGVNARNFEPGALGSVRVRRLDGAATWKYLD